MKEMCDRGLLALFRFLVDISGIRGAKEDCVLTIFTNLFVKVKLIYNIIQSTAIECAGRLGLR